MYAALYQHAHSLVKALQVHTTLQTLLISITGPLEDDRTPTCSNAPHSFLKRVQML